MRPKRPLASGFAVVVKVPSFYVCRKIKANSKIMLTHTHTFDVVAWFSTFFNGFSKECFLIRKNFCVYHYLMRALVIGRHLANLATKYLFEKSYSTPSPLPPPNFKILRFSKIWLGTYIEFIHCENVRYCKYIGKYYPNLFNMKRNCCLAQRKLGKRIKVTIYLDGVYTILEKCI